MNKFFQSKTFKIILVIIGCFIVLLLVFKLGMFVGGVKARFSYRWAENYHKNFAGPKGGFFGDWRQPPPFPGDFIESHGIFGSIIKIDGNTIIVKGKDNVEKTILVSEKTTITARRELLKVSDLKVDDQIVIIGAPNEQGQIEAKLIRLFP
jgi:hypothetical protein